MRFRRSQSNADASTELQQRPMRDVASHHSPAIVEVPELRDKQVRLALVFLQSLRDDDFCAGIICCSAAGASQP